MQNEMVKRLMWSALLAGASALASIAATRAAAIVWRRVEYDVEQTCKKIYAIPDLDDFLADRLREGR